MSKLKPIEAGCLAMIINSESEDENGRIVTVLECRGRCMTINGIFTLWRVDYVGVGNFCGTPCDTIRESRLIRIDDPDLKEESEESSATLPFERIFGE